MSGPCPEYADPNYNLCNIGLHELVASREHDVTPRGEIWHLQFVITNTASECEVEDRINGRITASNGSQAINPDLGIFTAFRTHPLRDYRTQRIGYYVWLVDAVYGYRGLTVMPGKPPWVLNEELLRASNIQATTIGGTKHITKNRWTVTWSENIPEMHGAIEWDVKGQAVKGIDVPSAEGQWREVYKFTMRDVFAENLWPPPGNVPDDLLESNNWSLNGLSLFQRWHKMVGWVHGYDWWLQVDSPCSSSGYRANKFRGFEQGALQFLGAEVGQLDTYNCEVTFSFRFEPNRWEPIPSTILGDIEHIPDERKCEEGSSYQGPEILIRGSADESGHEIFVHGFDYFQIFYENKDTVDADDEEEPDDGTIILPVASHYLVHQVFRYCPFEWLGIPALPMWDSTRDVAYLEYTGVCASPIELELKQAANCAERII